jgi:peptidoglycan/xylan/chitin deacetylase (PgdA/CDA1 family)
VPRFPKNRGLQLLNLAGNRLTTILFHRFFFEEESAERSRDRLKRQCEWLRSHFSPLSLESATGAFQSDQLPPKPLLITIDDAKIELLRVADIFAAFDLPISIFVCVGWSAKESLDEDSSVARLVNQIEWYAGAPKTIDTNRGKIAVGASKLETRKAVDLILSDTGGPQPDFEAILSILRNEQGGHDRRVTCSWAELADLKRSGASIGGHSVSHVNLAEASPLRMKFEIAETRRILAGKFDTCEVFAYPYGMSNTFSAATTKQLSQQGFRYAFLTHSDYPDSETDPLHLPRISMPDRAMSHPEFCVRASGVGVLYRKLKQARVLQQKSDRIG